LAALRPALLTPEAGLAALAEALSGHYGPGYEVIVHEAATDPVTARWIRRLHPNAESLDMLRRPGIDPGLLRWSKV